MINPVLLVAQRLAERLDDGISLEDIEQTLERFTEQAASMRATMMRTMLGMADHTGRHELKEKAAIQTWNESGLHHYSLVFTAHPIFALGESDAACLGEAIVRPGSPTRGFRPLETITLAEEHGRAMTAMNHVRRSLCTLNRMRLHHAGNWRGVTPVRMSLAHWVGYDLDGRDDIRWHDSFRFRLAEKALILEYYAERLAGIDLPLEGVAEAVSGEYEATRSDIGRFEAFAAGTGSLSAAANGLSERTDKVTDTTAWQKELLARGDQADDSTAIEARLLAWEMADYNMGVGGIHLRLNAIQIRNAMRTVDGRGLSEETGGIDSSRLLMERLSKRISTLEAEDVNFRDLDTERSTAGRLMILARQILKHIDSQQPIRLLVAECERPLTLLSSLFLARLYRVADQMDISPLFETRHGLEHGAAVIEQLLRNQHYLDYVRGRRRLSIQMGFSDAGRFVGQVPATLAIERLQLKLARVHQRHLDSDVALLLFNTHGESLGRGGARGSIANRQHYILSPHVRFFCQRNNIPLMHESAFQGGDGYLWFQNPDIADATIARLYATEFATPEDPQDPFYEHTDFALDLFLHIKQWQERLFDNSDYAMLLDLFGNNTLPTTGSRPGKRALSSLGARRNPSKIRAIVHNALLQQSGYLANVVGGLGQAGMLDIDQLSELYSRSPRLRQLIDHALTARNLGSTTALMAYGALFEHNFWINSAYQNREIIHVRSARTIAYALGTQEPAEAISRLSALLRDDLLDLARLARRLNIENVHLPVSKEHLLIDSLHVLRLMMMIQTCSLVSRLPRFAEHNATTRQDLIRMAIGMDIPAVARVIEQEFNLGHKGDHSEAFTEPGRAEEASLRYQEIDTAILKPIQRMHRMMVHISMVVGLIYGGHG